MFRLHLILPRLLRGRTQKHPRDPSLQRLTTQIKLGKIKAANPTSSTIEINKKNGPIYTGGDFNARIRNQEGLGDCRAVGPHTFDKHNTKQITEEGILENRQYLIEICKSPKQVLANTWFHKAEEQFPTCRNSEYYVRTPLKRHPGMGHYGSYDTLDYWLTEDR